MYLKLGSTNIRYESQRPDNFMIMSQVIDSGISFEKPILVSNKKQLDIWFGRNFLERTYFEELLDNNVTLFLTKPYNILPDKTLEDYIDLTLFQEDPNIYIEEEQINNLTDSTTIYKIYSQDGLKKDTESGITYDEFIYYLGTLVKIQDLPQNIEGFKSNSLNNRDTLKLYTKPVGDFIKEDTEENIINEYVKWKDLDFKIEYTTPEYLQKDASILDGFHDPSFWTETNQYRLEGSEKIIEIEEKSKILKNSLSKLNLNKVKRGYQTFAFDITCPDEISPGSYLVIQCLDYEWSNSEDNWKKYKFTYEKSETSTNTVEFYKNERELINCNINYHLFYYSGQEDLGEEEQRNFLETLNIDSKYWRNGAEENEALNLYTHQFKTKQELLDTLGNFGYYIDNESQILYSSFPVYTTYFYEFPGFSIEPNYLATHNLLNEIGKDKERITFWSKTIGSSGDNNDEGNIHITITELIKYFFYRVEIKRYDYEEVFEGYTVDLDVENTERLDYMISKYSSLVYCDINEDVFGELPVGTWEMKGAVRETNPSPQMYHLALDSLFNPPGEPVYFDFFLIPDISKYNKNGLDEDYGYYKDYILLKDYAENLNTQILIQNNIVDGKEEYLHNYTLDADNRLVYFYHDMTVQGEQRPGYYQHIRGLLSNIFSISTDLALYESPLDGKNSYKETDLTKKLDKYKSNYLIDNNQIYYYNNYKNGKGYNTTIWMRFALGKISRELEKDKWSYLGNRISIKIRDKIENILHRIIKSFSIIKSIQIVDFDIDSQNNKINITLNTAVNDLIKDDIMIDITIDYKKF